MVVVGRDLLDVPVLAKDEEAEQILFEISTKGKFTKRYSEAWMDQVDQTEEEIIKTCFFLFWKFSKNSIENC